MRADGEICENFQLFVAMYDNHRVRDSISKDDLDAPICNTLQNANKLNPRHFNTSKLYIHDLWLIFYPTSPRML